MYIRLETQRLKWDGTKGQYAPAHQVDESKLGRRFVRGPIPLTWLRKATSLPGKATSVALALWYQRGLTRALTVRFTSSMAAEMNVSPDAMYDALKNLERAGLITVDRGRGRCARVTILTD